MTANPYGNSGDEDRGSWCTPKELAARLGAFDLDPCSNERSHVLARVRAFGRTPDDDGLALARFVPAAWRVFINPPYAKGSVSKWIRAYLHTNYVFLLRFDPSTQWFAQLAEARPFVWFPLGWRVEFEPPPGVVGSKNPFPHALFAANPLPSTLCENGYGYVFRW